MSWFSAFVKSQNISGIIFLNEFIIAENVLAAVQ